MNEASVSARTFLLVFSVAAWVLIALIARAVWVAL